MLYKAIKSVSIAIFCFIGAHTVGGAYITPTATANTDITCGTGTTAADTCEINCDQLKPTIQNVNCESVGKCIIHCTADSCLKDTNIYASDTSNFEFDSTGKNCVQGSNMYLPNNGNASITANTQGGENEILDKFFIHSGTNTDNIYIECNDPSNSGAVKKDCYAIQIDAKSAQFLEIVINMAEFNGHETKINEAAIVECPVNSPLSPSCIIDANNAFSTSYLKIIADKGMPQDIVFYSNGNNSGDYTGTNIECTAGTSIINTNSFIGTTCYITLSPTPNPTLSPTYLPTFNPTTTPIINPTQSPSNLPTKSPSNLPTKSPSYLPTKTPIATNSPTLNPATTYTNFPSQSPSNLPTKSPTDLQTVIPSISPSMRPATSSIMTSAPTISQLVSSTLNTLIPTTSTIDLQTTTFEPNETIWICDGECVDEEEGDRIEIEVIYWFSDTVKYNLENIECFLYKIFEKWFERYQLAETFSFCDIDIIDIFGGMGNNDETFCTFGPCLYSNPSQRRRLLQNNDGNTSMTIIANDEDAYVLMNELSLNSMVTEFETAFLDHFDVVINVQIIVESGSKSNDNHKKRPKKNILEFNKLYYIIIGASILLCCIIALFLCYCIRSRGGKRKKKVSTSGVSNMVEEVEGYDMSDINTNATKNTSTGKNKKRQHKRSNTIDSWDLSPMHKKTTGEMWQNTLYAGGKTHNNNEENCTQTYHGRSISPLQENNISNRQSIEMITHNKLYTGTRKQQTDLLESDEDEHGFTTYGNAMNEYQQNMENNMNFQHAPHNSMGIDSIQPNVVNKLATKYNKKDKHKYKNQRKESVDDESSESSPMTEEEEEEEESSTRTLSDDNEYDEKDLLSDNEDDEITHQIDSENDNNVLDDGNHGIAQTLGNSGGDILTNMKGLLSFQHINCGDGIDKRPTGSVIVHRD